MQVADDLADPVIARRVVKYTRNLPLCVMYGYFLTDCSW